MPSSIITLVRREKKLEDRKEETAPTHLFRHIINDEPPAGGPSALRCLFGAFPLFLLAITPCPMA